MKPWILYVILVIGILAPPPLLAQEFIPVDARPAIRVSGVATVTAVPDRARISMAVTEIRPQANQAKDLVDAKAKEIQETLLRMGISETDIRASVIQIHPVEDHEKFSSNGRSSLQPDAFRVTRELVVDVTDIGRLDEVLDRAVALGTNQVRNVSLYSSREDALRLDALRLAAEDARQKAAVLAGKFDRRLKGVLMVTHEGDGGVRPFSVMMERGRGGPAFSPGTIEIEARVQVVFEME